MGPKSRELFREVVLRAKTIVWNGPVGVFEFPNYAEDPRIFCVLPSRPPRTEPPASSVHLFSLHGRPLDLEAHALSLCPAGGGDTATLVEQEGAMDKVSHVSTGGGVSLMLLEGQDLPAVSALSDASIAANL